MGERNNNWLIKFQLIIVEVIVIKREVILTSRLFFTAT